MTIIVVSCRTPREFFNRPKLYECITLIQDGATVGMMSCDGEVMPIPGKMIIPMNTETYEKAKKYYEHHEYQHYICVKYPKRCRK